MRGIRRKAVGPGGCCKGMVTQANCRRKAVVTRKTAGKGVLIRLCAKCDADFGDIVGPKVEDVQCVTGSVPCKPCADPEMSSEGSAWQAVVAEFKGLGMDINDRRYNKLVDMLRLWGERLAALRRTQDAETVQKAMDSAVHPRRAGA